MLTKEYYETELKKVRTVLKKFELFKQESPNFQKELHNAPRGQRRDYIETYNDAIEYFDYDFLLIDNSILQFKLEEREGFNYLRYNYIQNPQEFVSFEQYMSETFPEWQDQEDSEFIEDYEQFLSSQIINSKSIEIRYDFDIAGYKPLFHSVSHIHVGRAKNLRIPLERVLTPKAFTYFVIKNTYEAEWRVYCDEDSNYYETILREMKEFCGILSPEHFREDEKSQFYMT